MLMMEMVDEEGNYGNVFYDKIALSEGPTYILQVSGFDSNNKYNIFDDFGLLNGTAFQHNSSSCTQRTGYPGWFLYENTMQRV
jgi:hypothetical protein